MSEILRTEPIERTSLSLHQALNILNGPMPPPPQHPLTINKQSSINGHIGALEYMDTKEEDGRSENMIKEYVEHT